jgi:hypothetical protein
MAKAIRTASPSCPKASRVAASEALRRARLQFSGSSGVKCAGTTVKLITPSGETSTFVTSSLRGLDTTLGVLKVGFVTEGRDKKRLL